ncbi:OmpA family protein [bacterium]|nr:OmpA family protein [bacterium]MBU1613906.1 OmpA family protein [bacterium]
MFRKVILTFSLVFLLGLLIEGLQTRAVAQEEFKNREEIMRALSPASETEIEKMKAEEKPKPEKPRLPLAIQFYINSAKFHHDSILQLQALGEALSSKELRRFGFLVEGHTCSLGSEAYNKYLSRKRAEAVSSYLAKNYGLSPKQLEVVGYGEEKPRYSNKTEWGRVRNRRVEIVRLGHFPVSPTVSLNVDFKYKRYGETRELRDGTTLFSGDIYSVSFMPHEDCHVYVCQYQSDSPENWQQLFPKENYTKETNPVKANKFYRIPDIGEGWLELDKNTGEEKIVVIAHEAPLTKEQIELVLMPSKPSRSSTAEGEKEVEIEMMGVDRTGKPLITDKGPGKRPDPVRDDLPPNLFIESLRFNHR